MTMLDPGLRRTYRMANGELLTLAYGLYFAGITLGELICELGEWWQ